MALRRESDCFDRFQDERTNYLKAWNCLSERKASPEGKFMGFTPPTGGTKRNTAGRATPFRKIILARIRLSNYRTRRITPYSTLCSRIIHPVTQPSRPCNCFHAVFRRRAFPIRRPPPIFFITESRKCSNRRSRDGKFARKEGRKSRNASIPRFY